MALNPFFQPPKIHFMKFNQNFIVCLLSLILLVGCTSKHSSEISLYEHFVSDPEVQEYQSTYHGLKFVLPASDDYAKALEITGGANSMTLCERTKHENFHLLDEVSSAYLTFSCERKTLMKRIINRYDLTNEEFAHQITYWKSGDSSHPDPYQLIK